MVLSTKEKKAKQLLLPAREYDVFQADHQIVPISIREICEQRERFNIEPPYQRQDVWRRRENQQLIETILQGLGIGLFEGHRFLDLDGRSCWEILDGHNRIKAIQGFYDGLFKTWTPAVKKTMQPASKCAPIAINKAFSQLDPKMKNRFLDYHIAISKVPSGMSEDERAQRFLDIQTQKPCTVAERLNVYPSLANKAARLIEKNDFWQDFYIGDDRNRNRKQVYLSSLSLLALQISLEGKAELRPQNSFLPRLACGDFDGQINSQVIETIEDNLEKVCLLYSGMQFTERAASIAMYQSVLLLEQAGCIIQTSIHRGCLVNWLDSIIEASKHASGLPAYHRPISTLTNLREQQAFWEHHRQTILALCGVKS